jgi:hypothetical protein
MTLKYVSSNGVYPNPHIPGAAYTVFIELSDYSYEMFITGLVFRSFISRLFRWLV